MPANLPAEAKAKWIKVMNARTPEEKLEALRDFLSSVPRHKGTEKLISRVRRQMALLRREIEERKRIKKVGRRSPFIIPREGDLQLCIIGMPNSGKSSILRRLTNAKPKVSSLPFSTTLPVPGMFLYEGVLIQLIEVPSFFLFPSKGALSSQSLALIRNSDGLLMVLDAQEDPISQFKSIVHVLDASHINISKPQALVEIKRTRGGGIRVFGKLNGCTADDVAQLLRSYRIYNAIVRIRGTASIDDIESSLFESRVYKPTILLVNKVEDERSRQNATVLKSFIGERLPVLMLSAEKDEHIDTKKLGELILRTLNVIRVYTKEPNSPPSQRPLILPKGSRVIDVAQRIHSFLAENFKYAKVWSKRLPYSPQKVGADFILDDGDVVEIRI